MILQSFQLGPLLVGAIDATDTQYSDVFFEEKISIQEVEAAAKFKHPLRRREFLAGRAIVHSFYEIPPILSSDSGAPIWGQDFTGSISHKNGWVLASVVSSKKFRAVGLDLEETKSFPLDVSKVICLPEDLVIPNPFATEEERLALIFSCKESLFKALFPICQTWFGFQDAKFISYEIESGTFQLQILKDLGEAFKSGDLFNGYFKVLAFNSFQFVVSCVAIEAI